MAVARAAPTAKGKVCGQAIAITTLTPIRERKPLAKRMKLVRCWPGATLPLARLEFIFFGRWTMVDDLPGPRPGEPRRSLHSPYLLFESNYDGSWADYLDAFADHIPERLQKMWETCWGFDEVLERPGRGGRSFLPAPFKRYVAKNELEVLHFYSAYPDDTTRTVNLAVALADRMKRVGELDETARRLALFPVSPRIGLRALAGAWLRMVTERYKIKPLTVVSPIVPGREEQVREHLLSLGESPLARVPGTHFARFVHVPRELLHLGQPKQDVLDCDYLLFTSNHDGSTGEYLRALAREAGSLWDACAGYPGTDPDAFAGWLGQHRIHTRYFVTGIPVRPVDEVKAATDQRRRLAAELSATSVPAPSSGVSEGPFEPARTTPGVEARDEIAADQVQGGVLKGYRIDFHTTWYGLLRVRDADGARRVLRGWAEHVSFTGEDPKLDGAHLNLAFTYEGLQALGAREQWLSPLPHEFAEGAAARSAELGDRADSAKESWQFGAPSAHVLAIVHAASPKARDEAVARLEADLGEALVLEHVQAAGLLDRDPHLNAPNPGIHTTCASDFNREQFGFADGCSQPSIEDDRRDDVGDGVLATCFATGLRTWLEMYGLEPRRYWRGVAPGEFLLGYVNEDGEAAPGSASPLCPHGTFMVYRKLEQDVATFNEHTEGWAREAGLDPGKVRAAVVGRWPDGTPLTKSPGAQDGRLAYDRTSANDFGYRGDTQPRCPFGAHTRRTNPREDLPAGGEGTMRHRMIRRGMPYGPLYEDDRETTERGLMFICYGASISRGFETVQRAWCDTGFALGLGHQPDYLLQQRPAPGEAPIGALPITDDLVLPPPPKPFVTVRGTEYLLMPGRSGLQVLLDNP
jgi:Dyp-type peroxidase family